MNLLISCGNMSPFCTACCCCCCCSSTACPCAAVHFPTRSFQSRASGPNIWSSWRAHSAFLWLTETQLSFYSSYLHNVCRCKGARIRTALSVPLLLLEGTGVRYGMEGSSSQDLSRDVWALLLSWFNQRWLKEITPGIHVHSHNRLPDCLFVLRSSFTQCFTGSWP